jgi:hypothetical protein
MSIQEKQELMRLIAELTARVEKLEARPLAKRETISVKKSK